ncbi:MAG: uncharacterized protein KVP18_001414 [Porospora cf. gigantea A]|uniref:uncharacterized protein n=2 Tax=Porospora cf. gigantea A TaxID=2853593 RepID=UPI003559D28A|nr:MAG: hypothetical protein KVP18_001414 [Porospora cf. gigantea A]
MIRLTSLLLTTFVTAQIRIPLQMVQLRAVRPRFLSLQTRMESGFPLVKQDIRRDQMTTFFGTLSVGRNPTSTFKVLFDTGSSEVWVPDSSCISPVCESKTLYRGSSTLSRAGHQYSIQIQYLSGSLQGYQSEELLSFGDDLIVPRQTVDFATFIDIPVLADIAWDGIAGLAFQTGDQKAKGQLPLVETIQRNKLLTSKGLRNQAAFHFHPHHGSLTFGGLDSTLATRVSKIDWVPVIASQYWRIRLKGVLLFHGVAPPPGSPEKDPSYIALPDDAQSIVDTGTYLSYVTPERTTNASLLSRFLGLDCTKRSELPNMQLSFEGGHSVILFPDDYVVHKAGDAACSLGFLSDDQSDEDELQGGWTLGQSLFSNIVTIFDWEERMIGFARVGSGQS